MKKNAFRRLLLILLVMSMTLFTFACGEKPCTHKDDDGDGICDSCKEQLKSPEPEKKVDLVVDGKTNFQFVLTKDSISKDVIDEIQSIGRKLKDIGASQAKFVYEHKNTSPKEVEVLVGNVTEYGEEYDFDERSLGTDGYIVKIINSKIIITAGSSKALLKAVKEFGAKITQAPEDGEDVQSLVFTSKDEFYYIKNDYPITSMSFGGEDIRGFTIATYMYNLTYMEAAKNIQNTLYLNTGYWLDIVPIEQADKSIIIKEIANDGKKVTLATRDAESFKITAGAGTLTIECKYESMLISSVEKFLKTKITDPSIKGDLNFTGKVYTRDISVLTYEEFGAKGDGVSDDFFAIKAAHDAANEGGQLVMATPGKTYRIYDTADPDNRSQTAYSVIIKTNVIWTGANFTIDDREISTFDGTKRAGKHLFLVQPDKPSFEITDPEVLAYVLAQGIGKETTKIDIPGVDYDAMIFPYDTTHPVYRRIGYRSFTGYDMRELIVIDGKGNVDKATPVYFDYLHLTSILVYPLDYEPITIEGGTFTTLASQADIVIRDASGVAHGCEGGYIHRGLDVLRSNTVVKGVKHYVEGEITLEQQANGILGSPYNGFFCADFAHNVKFLDCILTGRRCYNKTGVPGAGRGTTGTYDYSIHDCSKIVYENCHQHNFWIIIDPDTGVITPAKETDPGAVLSMQKTTYGGINFAPFWGNGGANYTKNMEFINSTMSRYDAHAGLIGGKIIGCKIGEMTLTGAEDILIEDTVIYADGAGTPDGAIVFRSDYGATWEGTITFNRVKMIASVERPFVLLGRTYTNWFFGYVCAFPNVVLNDVEVVYPDGYNYNDKNELILTNAIGESALHLSVTTNTAAQHPYVDFNRDGLVDGTSEPYDKDKVASYYSGIIVPGDKTNFNPVKPPEFIKLLSNKAGLKIIIPDSSVSGASDGGYYDDVESYGGFFGDTKFYYSEQNYVIGTAGGESGDFVFRPMVPFSQ